MLTLEVFCEERIAKSIRIAIYHRNVKLVFKVKDLLLVQKVGYLHLVG